MKSNLFLRVLSALILTPVVLAAIIYGNPAYDILLAVVGSLMALEWEKMVTEKNMQHGGKCFWPNYRGTI